MAAKKSKTKEKNKTRVLDTIGIYDKMLNGKKVGTYKKNVDIEVLQSKSDSHGNVWSKTKDGWIMSYNKKMDAHFTLTIKSDTKNKDIKKFSKKQEKKKEEWKESNDKKWTELKVNTKFSSIDMNYEGAINKTMQLFGIPYQFLNSVDARLDDVSTIIGRKYIENFILNAPVVTFIPGVPTYLPGSKDKTSITQAFFQASTGNLGALQQLNADDTLEGLRLYDFKSAYTKYFQYVNILCRTIATFMEIDGNEDKQKYKINNEYPDFLSYDWKNYRWDGKGYHSAISNATSSAYESASNLTSKAKSLFDDLVKDGSAAWSYITGNVDSEDLNRISLTSTDYKSNSYYTKLTDEQKKEIDKIIRNGKTKKTPKTKKEKEAAKKKEKEALKKAIATLKSYVKNNNVANAVDKNKGDKNKSYIDINDDSVNLSSDEESIIETLGRKEHFIQFYVDPNGTNYTRSISNTTQDSWMKSTMDSATSAVRDIQFMTNTGGFDASGLQKLGSDMLSSLGETIGNAIGSDNGDGMVSRLMKFCGNVILGESMIIPQIYSGTTQGNDIQISIPLKCIYGNKYSMCMDFLFPLMHLVALAFPQATSANTFSAPFLVKCFMKGVFTCNLGIVTGISLQYMDSYNDDGLYMGAVVTLSVQDLYPDISMTPASNPITFVHNSSLIEYLATKCGLNLLESQFSTKVNLLINTLSNFVPDKVDTIVSTITEQMDEIIQSYTGL